MTQRMCVLSAPNKWCATSSGKRPGRWAIQIQTRCGRIVRRNDLWEKSEVREPNCKQCLGVKRRVIHASRSGV